MNRAAAKFGRDDPVGIRFRRQDRIKLAIIDDFKADRRSHSRLSVPGNANRQPPEKEARAWTIRKGWTAPQAAGVIHTDFERGFIKAEIVSYDDLVKYGSVAEARAHGRVRMEGKDYVMADGDVVEFRFNV